MNTVASYLKTAVPLKRQSRVSIGIVLTILLTLAYVAFGASLWLSGAN